jgi:hypothetical protein
MSHVTHLSYLYLHRLSLTHFSSLLSVSPTLNAAFLIPAAVLSSATALTPNRSASFTSPLFTDSCLTRPTSTLAPVRLSALDSSPHLAHGIACLRLRWGMSAG